MPTMFVTFDSTPVTLNQITEGNYSSEYFARTDSREYRLKVRHTKEKAVGSQPGLDRHNVELTVRTFPTAEKPAGSTNTGYFVIRSDPNSDGVLAGEIATNLAAVLTDQASTLIAWGSTFA